MTILSKAILDLSNRIFAGTTSLEVSVSPFNHCSSVCPIGEGNLLAWYAGSGECRDDQSVHLLFISKENTTDIVRIGDNTGNPVVWQLDNDHAAILWSKFENVEVRRLVDRWKHCTLWIQKLRITTGIEFVGQPAQLANHHQHLLGRCSPIWYHGQYLLPLYNEMERNCVIYGGNGLEFARLGTFGTNMIQPTIWAGNNKISALCRNFGNGQTNAKYCYSTDSGLTWSEPEETEIPNNNSSLHAVRWQNSNYLIWNDTRGTFRERLAIGMLRNRRIPTLIKRPLIVSTAHGAYPSACVNPNGSLAFSYTKLKHIRFHLWTPEDHDEIRANRRRDCSV